MPGGVKSQNIARAFFLAYFLVYAISPLSRTLTPQNAPELASSNSANYSTSHLHIFIWEVIFSRLTHSYDTNNDKEGAGVRVLIKKARAILPEDISKKGSSQERASLIESLFFSPVQISLQCFTEDESRQPLLVIGSLYSGHSPPFSTHLS